MTIGVRDTVFDPTIFVQIEFKGLRKEPAHQQEFFLFLYGGGYTEKKLSGSMCDMYFSSY